MLRNAHHPAFDERERGRTAPKNSGATPPADGVLHDLIEDLARDSRGLEARLQELEAVADLLRSEVEASAQRLRLLITELELAEERLQQERGETAPSRGPAANGHARAAPRSGAAGRTTRGAPPPRERLCAREREVLKLLTEGLSSPSIAKKLGIKTATVGVHRRNIMRKLNLHSIAALTKYALRAGLTSL